jgi:hypothetical protein
MKASSLDNRFTALLEPAPRENPAELRDEYSVAAFRLAFQRAALASYRLTEFLNTHFN